MKIYIGNDHTSVKMKNEIVSHLNKKGHQVIDVGVNNEDASDYPVVGKEVAKNVVGDKESLGIVLCGTGIGISIAANKIKGARAALVYDQANAVLAKQHNNANIIATGGRIVANEKAIEIVDAFLNTKFEGGRHQKRVEMIEGK